MKRTLIVALALVASSLFAQSAQAPAQAPPAAPPPVPNLFGNFINLNLQGANQNTNSSKFHEYRDVPEGVAGPAFRIFSDSAKTVWLVSGENLTQRDRRLYAWVDDAKFGSAEVLFDIIPHRLGDDAKSVEKIVSNEAQGISDPIQAFFQSQLEARFANVATRSQINYNFLRPLVEPLLNTPEVFDLGFTRQRAALTLGLFPDLPFDTKLSVFQENRDGTRSAGTSFGFGNVVETAEPIQYRTRDVRLSAEAPLMNNRLLLRGSIGVNQFQNSVDAYTFDNPFRVTDSTDAAAYQAPASGSVNGPAAGRIVLPADSRQINASFGGIYKLPRNSRFTADLAIARTRQNDELFPYTTNTAILAANPQLAQPPATRFDGKIDTTALNLAYTSRPIARLNLSARYRFYEVDNNSGRVEMPGWIAFDATYHPVPRISVPYGTQNNRGEILASYDFNLFTLEGGFRSDRMERTFRETRETTENIFHVAADVRPFTWLVWRNSFEFGDRDFDEYDQIRGQSASFEEEEQSNLPGLRRFDQAKRDTQRIVTTATATPFGGPVSITANFVRYFDDYTKDAEFGLLTWRNQSFTLDADYSPSDRWSVFGFYTHEDWTGLQRGRQSGATFSTNPLDNWTARNSDRANTFGVGANLVVIPDRANLNLTGRVNQVNGFGDFDSPPGGTPDVGIDIPNIDDTRFVTLTGELTYHFAKPWDVAVGAWVERYRISDALNAGTVQYLPASFFLAPNDLGYRGGAAYVRTTYRW